MNVQPKLPKPEYDPLARPAPAVVRMRPQPGGPRRAPTWPTWEEEPWTLDLEVEPWHP
jgi:hypothetical protein